MAAPRNLEVRLLDVVTTGVTSKLPRSSKVERSNKEACRVAPVYGRDAKPSEDLMRHSMMVRRKDR